MLITNFLVILASTLVSVANAKEITFHCAHGNEITIKSANGCYADSDCDTDEACDDNECMKTPVVTLSEEPHQVTDLVHINETSTVEESTSTGTTSATSATSSPSDIIQYTPDLADWTKMNEKALGVSSVTDHTPDGVRWATYVEWDGEPRTFESFSSKNEFFEWICHGAIPRGIREVYYKDPVFTDPMNPTKAEVDL
jgi:hypothetical protein